MILFARSARWALLSCSFFVLAVSSLFAQSVDPQKMLKELEQIQKGRSNNLKSGLQEQMSALSAASASKGAALSLYEDAVQAVQYEGKPKDGAEFAAWRDKNAAMLGDENFRSALQIHLQYLVLSLRRLQGETNEDLQSELIAYVNRLAAVNSALNKMEKPKNDVQLRNEKARPKDKQGDKPRQSVVSNGRDVLTKSLSGSVFIKWYRLDGYMKDLKDWEAVSGNLESIVDKSIFPHMRETKDSRLLPMWDERVARAEEDARRSSLDIDLDKYQNETLPTLLWGKAQDRIILGQRNAAMVEMFNIIKNYQSHPNFEKWNKELVALLKGTSVETAEAESGIDSSGGDPASAPASTTTAATTTAPAPAP